MIRQRQAVEPDAPAAGASSVGPRGGPDAGAPPRPLALVGQQATAAERMSVVARLNRVARSAQVSPATAGGLDLTPAPGSEAERLAALATFGLDEGPLPEGLDGIARLAAFLCGTATASINILTRDTQRQIGSYGCPTTVVPRASSICGEFLSSKQPVFIADASLHPDLRVNPFVNGTLGNLRMYASTPLLVPGGHVIGTLCAFDARPGALTEDQLGRLSDLAKLTTALLEARRLTRHMQALAVTDSLTGLPNRSVFDERLARRLNGRRRGDRPFGIAMVDINDFKIVNDTFGHAAGDAVLVEVAQRLASVVREGDLLVRLGGDEFVAILDGIEDTPSLQSAKRRLQGTLDEPITCDGWALDVRVAIGATLANVDDSALSIVRRADSAMYADKRAASKENRSGHAQKHP